MMSHYLFPLKVNILSSYYSRVSYTELSKSKLTTAARILNGTLGHHLSPLNSIPSSKGKYLNNGSL